MKQPEIGIEISPEERASLDQFFWDNYDPLSAPSEMLEELDALIDESLDNETFEIDVLQLIALWHKYNPKNDDPIAELDALIAELDEVYD